MTQVATKHVHHDHIGSKMGMWIFILTELLLFGGLFLVYTVYRAVYTEEFHNAALELNAIIGTVNTLVLLISSMTVAMSITAVQKGETKRSIYLLLITIGIGLLFLVNKYFEWGHKIHLDIYPGSDLIMKFERGELLFFGLYYFMTGLHALHIVVGVTLLIISLKKVMQGKVNHQRFTFLENTGLYWHLVDLIWIFLFPLLYLVT